MVRFGTLFFGGQIARGLVQIGLATFVIYAIVCQASRSADSQTLLSYVTAEIRERDNKITEFCKMNARFTKCVSIKYFPNDVISPHKSGVLSIGLAERGINTTTGNGLYLSGTKRKFNLAIKEMPCCPIFVCRASKTELQIHCAGFSTIFDPRRYGPNSDSLLIVESIQHYLSMFHLVSLTGGFGKTLRSFDRFIGGDNQVPSRNRQTRVSVGAFVGSLNQGIGLSGGRFHFVQLAAHKVELPAEDERADYPRERDNGGQSDHPSVTSVNSIYKRLVGVGCLLAGYWLMWLGVARLYRKRVIWGTVFVLGSAVLALQAIPLLFL